MKQYDAIIIGLDKASKALAIELTKKQWTVAIIGCASQYYCGSSSTFSSSRSIKNLIFEAHISNIIIHNSFDSQASFYKDAIARKDEFEKQLNEKNKAKLNSVSNITLLTGNASFTSPNSLLIIDGESQEEIEGKEIIINTGEASVAPMIDGINESKYAYSTESLLNNDILPKHLVIVSQTSSGLELASMYSEFGTKVTLLTSESSFMNYTDKDIAGCVQSIFEKRGISIIINNRPLSIKDNDNDTTLTYLSLEDNQQHSIEADAILAITTQKPRTKGLNLMAAGVQTDESGAIITNNHLHTTQPGIWAMGSARGIIQGTYLAIDDCRIILSKLFGNEEHTTEDRVPVPYSLFIDPPLSHVGVTETEAQQGNYPFKVSRIIIKDGVKNQILKPTDGIMKAIINTDTNRIVGCTLFCDDAIEIINIVNIAMKSGQPYTFLRDFFFTHPGINEYRNKLFCFD